MGLIRTIKPTSDPVSLSDTKLHLRYEESEDNPLIEREIKSATDWVEQFLNRQLMPATYELTLSQFPGSVTPIWLDKPPTQSITAITYFDAAEVEQTFPAADYVLDISTAPATVRPVDGKTWPSTDTRPEAAKVTYVAGYADADAIPGAIKSAVMYWVSHLYEHREPVVLTGSPKEIPMGVNSLLWPHRIVPRFS